MKRGCEREGSAKVGTECRLVCEWRLLGDVELCESCVK